jgi:hypothetical protein
VIPTDACRCASAATTGLTTACSQARHNEAWTSSTGRLLPTIFAELAGPLATASLVASCVAAP